MTLSNTEIKTIVQEAVDAAETAADKFFQEKLNGEDQYAFGFAWVEILSYGGKKIRANSTLGKSLINAGVDRDTYRKCFRIWNPSNHRCQNIDTKEAGAAAAAAVFKKYGFDAWGNSRLD
jgi:hypothetical protein